MANEKKQYWAASNGSIVLFDYNDENDDVEDYIIENWGDCEYGEFSSFTDLRNEEEEEWFNQQSFKGTSWNYVLDEAEKHFKCSLNSEMNEKEKKTHEFLYKLWNKLKEEEEEERYCDNEKCPYEGYCFGEVKEQFEGKPYICEGCSTGIGLQEEEFTQQTFEALSAAIVSEEEKDSARVFLFGKQEEAEDKGEMLNRIKNIEEIVKKMEKEKEEKRKEEDEYAEDYLAGLEYSKKKEQERIKTPEMLKRLANLPYYKRVRFGN